MYSAGRAGKCSEGSIAGPSPGRLQRTNGALLAKDKQLTADPARAGLTILMVHLLTSRVRRFFGGFRVFKGRGQAEALTGLNGIDRVWPLYTRISRSNKALRYGSEKQSRQTRHLSDRDSRDDVSIVAILSSRSFLPLFPPKPQTYLQFAGKSAE